MSDWDSRVRWEPDTLGQAHPTHVPPVLRGQAHEIRDDAIEDQKAGNRGLMLSELQDILATCRTQSEQNPGDPRWDELRLRALDRLAKLLRLYESQAPQSREGEVDRRALEARVAGDLDALEAKIRQ